MKRSLIITCIALLAGCSSPQAPPIVITTIPGLSIPDTIDFGKVRLGESKDTSIPFKNIGSDTINITSQRFNDSLFTLGKAGISALSIAPGTNQAVNIKFVPFDTSAALGFDSIHTASKTNVIVLRGNAISFSPVGLSIPDTIDFGTVRAGLSKTLSVTFQNTGSDSILISSQTISNSFFQEDPRWKQFYIAPDSSRIVNITYFPHNSIDIAFDTIRSGSKMSIIKLIGREVPFSSDLPSAPKEITISLSGVIGRSDGSPHTFSFYYDEPDNLSKYHDSNYSFYGNSSGSNTDFRGDVVEWWSNTTDIAVNIDTNWIINSLNLEFYYSYNTRGGFESYTKNETLKMSGIAMTKSGNSVTAVATGSTLRNRIDTIYIQGNSSQYAPDCADNLPLMDSLIGFTDSAKLSIMIK